MPTIYLSPSTQEFNPYVNGGNEEYYMNLIADAMIPYLDATGIDYVRNTPDMTAASSIKASNSGNYDFHLALHSNAVGGENSGSATGSQVYYYPYSQNSKRAADIFANNLKLIYPNPSKVITVPTTSLGEVARTKAPAVLIEYAFHDNEQDANWIKNNINLIAENTVVSLADYFGIPFKTPDNNRRGKVTTNGGNLNIRSGAGLEFPVIGTIPNGQTVSIIKELPMWYNISYNGVNGYSFKQYIKIL